MDEQITGKKTASAVFFLWLYRFLLIFLCFFVILMENKTWIRKLAFYETGFYYSIKKDFLWQTVNLPIR